MNTYILVLNNGSEYKITEEIKNKIINSDKTRFELPNGTIVNIAYMVEIKKDPISSYKLTKTV